MTHIPPELISVIVEEIWHSKDPEPSLSALCLVWKDAIPFVRQHRFYAVNISKEALPYLLTLIDDPSHPFSLVHKLTGNFRWRPDARAYTVIAAAINVEDLSFTPAGCPNELSLSTHLHLTTLNLYHGHMSFHSIISLLHEIPHLTSLTLSEVGIDEFSPIIADVWPLPYWNSFVEDYAYPFKWDEYLINAPKPFDWGTHWLNTPRPLPNISHLTLNVDFTHGLMLLDFITSTKCPFPNVQNLVVSDTTNSDRSIRFNALLQKYSSSLTVFEVHEPQRCDADEWDNFTATPITLPVGVEHFTFFVDLSDICPYTFYHNVSSGALKAATMHLCLTGSHYERSPEIGELDRKLASLDIECFNVHVDRISEDWYLPNEYAEELVEELFPLITERFLYSGESGSILWSDKGSKCVCPYCTDSSR